MSSFTMSNINQSLLLILEEHKVKKIPFNVDNYSYLETSRFGKRKVRKDGL